MTITDSPRITGNEKRRFISYFLKSVKKLESPKNKNKDHWSTQSLVYLSKRLREEENEFREAFMRGHCKSDMIDELKDIINFALMLWDNLENNSAENNELDI
jgi:hypothetical protein